MVKVGLRYFAQIIGTVLLLFHTNVVHSREVLHEPWQLGLTEKMSSATSSEFENSLQQFDHEIAAAPFDVALRLSRCDFMQDMATLYEYAEWTQDLYERVETCVNKVAAAFPNHPTVTLYRAENSWGDELIEILDQLPDRSALNDYQVAQKYTLLANAHRYDDLGKASVYAESALQWNVFADVRLILGEFYAQERRTEELTKLFDSPFHFYHEQDASYRSQLLVIAADAEDAVLVRSLYDDYKSRDLDYWAESAAKALRRTGYLDLASEEFKLALEDTWEHNVELFTEHFLFEYERGNPEAALSALRKIQASDPDSQMFGENRFALLRLDPTLSFNVDDFVSVGWVLAYLAAIAALAALVLVPIQYHQLLTKRTLRTPVFDDWGVRAAWLGLFALFGLDFVAGVVTGPYAAATGTEAESDIAFGANSVIWGTTSALLLGATVWLKIRRPLITLGEWPLWKWLLIPFLIALALRLPTFAVALADPDLLESAIAETFMGTVLVETEKQYGVLVTLFVISVGVPIAEEFVFRSLLLNCLSKYLNFTSANLVQAVLFGVIHFEPAHMPLLIVFGFIAGVLAKRSQGLAAPIVMHAAFNGTLMAMLFM